MYLDVAQKHALDPVHLAMAFCLHRPFPCIPIFGATTIAQLDQIVAGADVELNEDVLSDLTAAHRSHPMPF